MSNSIYTLEDFCDMDSLYKILADWSKCTGLSSGFVNAKGEHVSQSFEMSPVCALIQKKEEGLHRCGNNWTDKKYGIHRCHAGFYDFAIPLLLPDGTFLGRVMAGQVYTDDITEEEILEKICPVGIDREEALAVLKTVPRKSLAEMQSCYNLLKQMIDFFLAKSYSNYQEIEARKFDVAMLTAALNTVFRLSIYFNLTKNEFHLIDYDPEVTKIVPAKGSIDQIVNIGVSTIPDPEHAQEYYRLFNREALMEAFQNGAKEVKLLHQQKLFDGTIHWMEACAVLVNTSDDECHAICLNKIVDEEIKNKLELQEAYQETMRQQRKLEEALDNYKQADYDRRRDFLTGLRNRQDMFELLNDTLSGKRSMISSMYMMDIDNFKKLNDIYGHTYGDECLKKIGKALNEYGEKNDIYFFRYGGEEMLGIGFEISKKVEDVAQELVKLISDLHIERKDNDIGIVTVSLGYTTNNSRFEKMIDKADKAMYKAKELGKNRAVSYESF